MVKVKINGIGNDGVRTFEILDREKIEETINGLNEFEIFQKTFEEAEKYGHSGTAYTYIDARDGSIHTYWLQQNTVQHPWDSFYEIRICSVETGTDATDLNTPFFLLDEDEQKDFLDYEGTAEDFLLEKYGQEELEKRAQNAIDWLAMEFQLDQDSIQKQLDELFCKEE